MSKKKMDKQDALGKLKGRVAWYQHRGLKPPAGLIVKMTAIMSRQQKSIMRRLAYDRWMERRLNKRSHGL